MYKINCLFIDSFLLTAFFPIPNDEENGDNDENETAKASDGDTNDGAC